MPSQRRLGRGLEALLGKMAGNPDANGQSPESQSESPASQPEHATDGNPVDGPRHSPATQAPEDSGGSDLSDQNGLMLVDIRHIESSPFQPREDFDEAELCSLAESLTDHGLLQPLVVRRVDDRFQLIAGERRLRAAAKAGWTEVPVTVVEADDRQSAELTIVENLQRKDLNPLEKAASFQRYLETYAATQEELAGRLKLDRSTIANLIRLLELPKPVQEAIRQGKITQGHARALLPLGDEHDQVRFCQRIREEGLSVRRTEALVQEMIQSEDTRPLGLVGLDGSTSRPHRPPNEQIAALEQEFRSALGMRVKLTHSSRGRGKLLVQFASHEEFERLRQHICGAGQADLHGKVG